MPSTPAMLTFLLLLASISGVHATALSITGDVIGGLLGLIILILDIIAIVELVTSTGRDVCMKVVWVLIILFFPIGGLILYFCCARNQTVDQSV